LNFRAFSLLFPKTSAGHSFVHRVGKTSSTKRRKKCYISDLPFTIDVLEYTEYNIQKRNNNNSNNSTNKMQQFSQVYYLTFMCGSTGFGRLHAHHKEHTTELGASGFTVGEKRLERCWSWFDRLISQTTTNNT
jgi:hypothetical protein